MDNQGRIDSLAKEVLSLSRGAILLNLRFMDLAVHKLFLLPNDKYLWATDGTRLLYSPSVILKKYRNERTSVTRDYLHALLHCVFCHMYVNPFVRREIWNLACDIAVENTISDLGINAAESTREGQQKEITKNLSEKVKGLTAERLYRYFLDSEFSAEQIDDLHRAFTVDDHCLWYRLSEGVQDTENDDQQGNDISFQNPYSGNQQSEVPSQENENEWREISKRVQEEITSFTKARGEAAGSLIQNLKELHREHYDYSTFLKKFAVLGETMKVNDDEFDYIFYTYGMKLFGKMPLIEPLEYKETKKIKEFVIAIDTSGSVAGDTVQRFIQKTWNVLKSTESFFSRINLHIIQCDAEIQEDYKITTQEECDNYLLNMSIKGLGGTDFRPVFAYVDELCTKKEFTNLRGLLYFTDGLGVFPQYMPQYQTAFVFLEDEQNNYSIPPWAMKLVLREEDF